MRDEMVRAACFASLDVLCAQFGDDVPYKGGLDRGFLHGGQRVAFLSPQKGIFRAATQTGPAALSINTSSKSPYGDAEVEDGYLYAYRSGPVDQPDNRALRQAYVLQVPLVYFVATRPGWYRPLYPAYVTADDPTHQRVLVSPGRMIGPLDEPEPVPFENEIERRYAVRATRVRLIKPSSAAACCARTRARARSAGCGKVGVSPGYTVQVSKRLLEEEDGPMLELLKQFHTAPIGLPKQAKLRPDRERLAERFERFAAAS